MTRWARVIDLTGRTFGRLTVQALTRGVDNRGIRTRLWICRCTCGRETTIQTSSLTSGVSQSCGCLRLELQTKHGHTRNDSRTHEYCIWENMRARCFNPKAPHFDRYGGRGISVCTRWDNFAAFLSDMGPCPPGLTLERIDNDQGYSPDNCRWATHHDQCRNRASTIWLTMNDETMCVTDWASRLGLDRCTIYCRLRAGWSTEKALTTIVKPRKRHRPAPTTNSATVAS